MKLVKKQALGIKQETTQGTPVVPASATDFLLVEDANYEFVGEALTRNFRRASIDTLAHVFGKRNVRITFATELKGSGTAGTAAIAGFTAFDAAMQACAFSSTLVGGTSITYAPVSAAASASYYGPGKSVTIELYRDGLKHIIAGALGSWKISAKSGQYPRIEFEFMGTYTEPTDNASDATPTPTISNNFDPPIWESSTVSVNGFSSPVIDEIEIEVANEIERRDDAKVATSVLGFVITGRDPKGSVFIEAEKIATLNVFNKLVTSVQGTTSVVFGTGAGKIITITMTKSQLSNASYEAKGGFMMHRIPLNFPQNSGDDWISIAIT